ncbi:MULTISPECIES: lactate utilization protein C [unclassified Campylobacter]|uniref:LutC/YkgG family protein n=1 Tax=unclassified Campylobacter TaxID=2593542 RepID=UPI001237C6D3|nr:MULTISPECIES: lactate utilization protein C [unclassified Campylobacter]KAA6225039.1 lactate utilization protein C [Campylobacter sp. LR185c]KAA6225998.1 lactate utilization protein C [Campylobacter sp. LR196d]KAA6226057.1 lactate utilization protein C [Campylobacter sp. LR286c]KAA6230368.1 lactate utilization protein C [Campylobacter sp. LR264d]KAA6230993.1 lactate utilization protein C [Campylobacter sp. LR291e]
MSRIDEISKSSKEKILAKFNNAYKIPEFESSASIDPVEHIITKDDACEEMKQKMSDNKYVVEVSSFENLEEKINEISASYGYEKLIYPANLGLNLDKIKASEKICFDKEIENLRTEVFHSDFSIINARVGVSSHGVALVLSSKEQPRMLSLAPKLCIMLLKKENVVKSISQALNLVKKEHEILPTNILFIAGPSRTADIELITVFGVHGPQKVHIILY